MTIETLCIAGAIIIALIVITVIVKCTKTETPLIDEVEQLTQEQLDKLFTQATSGYKMIPLDTLLHSIESVLEPKGIRKTREELLSTAYPDDSSLIVLDYYDYVDDVNTDTHMAVPRVHQLITTVVPMEHQKELISKLQGA